MARRRRLPGRLEPAKSLALLVTLAVALILPQFLGAFFMSMLLLVVIYGLLAMSINLLGYTGLVTLGQAGIFAASAYGVAYVVTYSHGSYVEQILIGLASALAVSIIFGVMSMRTIGVYFLMVTLAQGQIVFGLTNSIAKLGADSGLPGIDRPGFLHSDKSFYYMCVLVVLICAVLMWVVVKSPFGLAMRGLQASPTRLRQLGYNTTLHNFYSFVIAGFFAGVAGILFVYNHRFVSPDAASFNTSAIVVLMVIVGGIGTMSGPMVGAVIIVAIQNWLSLYVERWPIIEGVIFVVVVLFAREGIVGAISKFWSKRVHRRPPPTGQTLLATGTEASLAAGGVAAGGDSRQPQVS